MNCICPPPASLDTIPDVVCPENFGQIQKIIFQRAAANFVFTDPATQIADLASWTPLLVAAGDTKVVVTPFLENVVIPAPEPITEGGGDNTTLNGREIVVGETNPVATGMFRSIESAIILAMKKLACEDLVVFFINENNKIIGRSLTPGATPTDEVTGIPIHALFIGDLANEGKNTQDKGPIRFGLDYGWRDNAVIVTTNFNPKADL